MKKVWIIHQGRYYTDQRDVVSVHRTKKGAIQKIRTDGFRWDGEQGFYCNETAHCLRELVQVRWFD